MTILNKMFFFQTDRHRTYCYVSKNISGVTTLQVKMKMNFKWSNEMFYNKCKIVLFCGCEIWKVSKSITENLVNKSISSVKCLDIISNCELLTKTNEDKIDEVG